jgi:hypothetical protein
VAACSQLVSLLATSGWSLDGMRCAMWGSRRMSTSGVCCRTRARSSPRMELWSPATTRKNFVPAPKRRAAVGLSRRRRTDRHEHRLRRLARGSGTKHRRGRAQTDRIRPENARKRKAIRIRRPRHNHQNPKSQNPKVGLVTNTPPPNLSSSVQPKTCHQLLDCIRVGSVLAMAQVADPCGLRG